MNYEKENRVLSRLRARELSEEEENQVQGAIHTTTKCSGPTPTNPSRDGDPGECGQLY